MAKRHSTDLRVRVVALVEAGESRREAARLLDLAASTTIRWLDRWQTTGSVAAKPGTGHCRSPLEQHEQWLLDLEREAFLSLCGNAQTRERMQYMLKHGKALRN